MHKRLLALVLLACVGSGTKAVTAQETGAIVGRVVTTTGALVAGATVALRQDSGQGTRAVRRATTDADGAFRFARVPAGRYRVVANKAGYTARQALQPGASGLVSGGVGGMEVEVGGDISALDVEVLLLRAGRISGRVVDVDGSGVRASLVLHEGSESSASSISAIVQTGQTGLDGRFTLTDLPPGNYLLEATVGAAVVPGIVTPGTRSAESQIRPAVALGVADIRRAWYPGVADRQAAATITLAEGELAAEVDIWVPSQPRSGVVGRVAWPVGVQVESIAIDYGDPGGERSGVWVVADPEGRFSLSGVRPGPLVLLAHVQTDQGLLMGAASLDVTEGSMHDVPILVDRPGTVEGQVIYQGEVPASARGATVVLNQKRMRVTALYPVPVAAVDADGRFRATDALGDYEFELRGLPAGYGVTQVLRDGKPLPSSRLAVGGGEAVRGVELVVSRAR